MTAQSAQGRGQGVGEALPLFRREDGFGTDAASVGRDQHVAMAAQILGFLHLQADAGTIGLEQPVPPFSARVNPVADDTAPMADTKTSMLRD
ncbi:MAG: hypothetical protein VCB63_16080 [Alphaproteobacteria bacterium]